MVRKFLLILVAALVVFGFAQTSQAVLSAVGPVDPGNGFPLYYADGGAVNNPAACPGGLCLIPCFTLNPANPAANPFSSALTRVCAEPSPIACRPRRWLSR